MILHGSDALPMDDSGCEARRYGSASDHREVALLVSAVRCAKARILEAGLGRVELDYSWFQRG